VDVTLGGADGGVSQDSLEGVEVHAVLESVSGEAMPQGVRGGGLVDATPSDGFGHNSLRPFVGHGLAGAFTREEIRQRRTSGAPVGLEVFEESGAEGGEPVFAAFSEMDVNDAASPIDVSNAKVAGFGDAHSGGIGGEEESSETEVGDGGEEYAELV